MKTLIEVDPIKFKNKRLSKGWSIRKLALKSNVCKATVINIEKGKHKTEEYTLAKLSEALEANIEDLKVYEK